MNNADEKRLIDMIEEGKTIDSFVDAGFTSLLSINRINEALAAFALHHCVLAVKSRVRPVLEILGVLEAVRKYREQFKPLFQVAGRAS